MIVPQLCNALSIFNIVNFLIIFGRKSIFNIPIWTSMLLGAGFVVGFQIISIESTFNSINIEIIGFLFGLFSIISAL